MENTLKEHSDWLKDPITGRNANLRNADLRNANLRNADLRNANLRNADLRNADLRHADLRGADLRRADLRRADLRDANLWGADLRDANLWGADLRDANLWGADLRDANLRHANLRDANLDFSCIPLWCGGLDFTIDDKVAKQLLYHAFSLAGRHCSPTQEQINFINDFHRVKSGCVPAYSEGVQGQWPPRKT